MAKLDRRLEEWIAGIRRDGERALASVRPGTSSAEYYAGVVAAAEHSQGGGDVAGIREQAERSEAFEQGLRVAMAAITHAVSQGGPPGQPFLIPPPPDGDVLDLRDPADIAAEQAAEPLEPIDPQSVWEEAMNNLGEAMDAMNVYAETGDDSRVTEEYLIVRLEVAAAGFHGLADNGVYENATAGLARACEMMREGVESRDADRLEAGINAARDMARRIREKDF